eukprot:comp19084_c1_seq1/m.21597 comp19084_c1_seq1/g.21597  ORF comp19084_c1_seq1/g.21597 comp19084_c1_seq1/m.21597 type:complete len:140 (+) comp19084_c1_seq1:629-1048(+)
MIIHVKHHPVAHPSIGNHTHHAMHHHQHNDVIHRQSSSVIWEQSVHSPISDHTSRAQPRDTHVIVIWEQLQPVRAPISNHTHHVIHDHVYDHVIQRSSSSGNKQSVHEPLLLMTVAGRAFCRRALIASLPHSCRSLQMW